MPHQSVVQQNSSDDCALKLILDEVIYGHDCILLLISLHRRNVILEKNWVSSWILYSFKVALNLVLRCICLLIRTVHGKENIICGIHPYLQKIKDLEEFCPSIQLKVESVNSAAESASQIN